MTTATQTLVLVDRDARLPQPIPESCRAPLRAFEGTHLEE
jgi:acyl-CoA thioesterase FadM